MGATSRGVNITPLTGTVIVSLQPGADATRVRRALVEHGLWVQPLEGDAAGAHLLVERHSAATFREELLAIDGVAAVLAPASAHPLVDAQPSAVTVSGRRVGAGAPPCVMAGPCGVESERQIHALAAKLAPLGVAFLRGGAYKPRTSPYAFQGHGEPALRWLRRAADEHGMLVVTEAMGEREAPLVAEVADLVQIGSRNMDDYALLRTVAQLGKPMLLKRGMAATVEEWLCAGEYCLHHGAASVIFCERGVRGFDPSTRNLLDLGAVALLAHVHRVPVIVDPSHAAGRRDLVAPLARAAMSAGAAGLLVETHDDPGAALSDGPQALSPAQLATLVAPFTTAAAAKLEEVAHVRVV